MEHNIMPRRMPRAHTALCFVVVRYVTTHIIQGYFTGNFPVRFNFTKYKNDINSAIHWHLPYCQWNSLDEYGKIIHITLPKPKNKYDKYMTL